MSPFAKVSVNALPHHDGVVIKHASFCSKSFPFHFHNEWSLGLVMEGSEQFSSSAFNFSISANTLILIPPNSIHANAGVENLPWKYCAIYLSDCLMQWCFKLLGLNYEKISQQTYFINQEPKIIKLFYQLTAHQKSASAFEKNVLDMLNLWLRNVICGTDAFKTNKTCFSELLHYLHLKQQHKITLDTLSQQFGMDKFKLLRLFKSSVGLSPLEYQTSLRIETSKQRLLQGQALQDVCFETGFYDLSHFSHTFKKFTGVSPQIYKKSCNILQAEAMTAL